MPSGGLCTYALDQLPTRCAGRRSSSAGSGGAWTARIETLRTLVDAGVLSESVPGSYAHFAHKRHLAGNTIEGHASRALCGVFFVPTQDHATLPQCPRCGEEYTRLPQ